MLEFIVGKLRHRLLLGLLLPISGLQVLIVCEKAFDSYKLNRTKEKKNYNSYLFIDFASKEKIEGHL